MARWADELDVPPGTHLVDQGRFPHEFFVILDGSAEVTIGGEQVTELGPGDFFGEIAILEHDRRTASVVATSPMRVAVMHERDFRTMQAAIPTVAGQIHAAVRERSVRR